MNNHQNKNEKNSEDIKSDIINLPEKYFELKHSKQEFVPGKTYIPCAGKVIDENDLKQLISSSLDLWLTSGRYSIDFEKKLAQKVVGNFENSDFIMNNSFWIGLWPGIDDKRIEYYVTVFKKMIKEMS